MGSDGRQSPGITRGRVALDGFAVISDHEQQRGGQRTFEGHGVCTFDAKSKQVVLYW